MSSRAADKALAAAPEDRRFRRTQVRPARSKTRDRLALVPWVRTPLLATAVLGTVAVLLHALAGSSRFQVRHVTVTGNVRLSHGEVMALLDGLEGQHLLDVDLEAWRGRLLGSPWVAEVRLRRVLPATVDVAIEERAPLATARIAGQLFLVDEQGAVIDEYGPQYADIDLPIIDGLVPEHGDAAERAARTALAGRVLMALSARHTLLQRVSQIDVRDPRNAVVMLKEDGTRVLLGETAFAERLESYVELAPALLARVPEIDYVDLRFGPRVFVRPAKGQSESVGKTSWRP
jgi:cell division protein FtsQ